MSGFICGYMSCICYLGSRVPHVHRNVSTLFALYALLSQKCFLSLFVYFWKMCCGILRSAFGTCNMEVTVLNWFLSDFVCCCCLLSSFQLKHQNIDQPELSKSVLLGLHINTSMMKSQQIIQSILHGYTGGSNLWRSYYSLALCS